MNGARAETGKKGAQRTLGPIPGDTDLQVSLPSLPSRPWHTGSSMGFGELDTRVPHEGASRSQTKSRVPNVGKVSLSRMAAGVQAGARPFSCSPRFGAAYSWKTLHQSIACSVELGQSTSHLQAWVSTSLKCGRGDGDDIHLQVCHADGKRMFY